ncbi:MAG: DNA primase [Veillonella sp.]|uniref:DNA primase n=1 Tax=Veillonella sp. TaxID=1926307 RepID=UPI0025DFC1D3|nr:DNA primase [Veillonella sp.]MBS4913986.1 DNA primase [Veillonella sp.]
MNRHFDDDLIEQIKNANDIVEVISEHVPLKKNGRNFWGRCPFHNESTPSFSVTPEKGFFYCFGCHESGNVISFLMKIEGLTFPAALEKLANRANIRLPEKALTEEERKRKAHRDELYRVNDLAANYFHNCLMKTEMGKVGLEYLQRRGLSLDIIKRFRLGFAPDSWDRLYRDFIKRGIDERTLIELGLCRKNNTGKVYDYFRNRVMYPIADGRGRIVAFGGRVFAKDDNGPKYLNSPETSIFSKGHMLFAFDKAYETVRKKRQVILVEGYMDVISAHNAGVTNVVASLGTAFTANQGRLFVRQADEVVLAYDMDGAGQKAARKAIEILQDTDFKVRIVAMPDGKDPDEYVKNHGGDAFLELVDQAITPFEFFLNESLIQHDRNTSAGKQAILMNMFNYIKGLTNPMERENALKALALPLWMDTSTILRMFRQYTGKGTVAIRPKAPNANSLRKTTEEDFLMAMALESVQNLERVRAYLPAEDFEKEEYRSILEKAGQVVAETGQLQTTALEERLTEEEQEAYAPLMMLHYEQAALDGYIRAVRLKSLREQYKKHSTLADQLNRAGDSRFIEELKLCQELQTLIKEWS